jgi:CubicO group peptidase (beta-lactamase class C family)
MRAFGVLAVVLACSGPFSAQEHQALPIRSEAVAAFADDFFPSSMAHRHIPGLVFVFVSDGEIRVLRGFGVAELDPRRPVDPDRTRFRLASVSKAITASAALKLVEDGRLDLNKPVNAYPNGFRITDDASQITLHHLLTHTAGFDERLIGLAARSAKELQPLAEYLAQSMPPTFIEPGRITSYSNHGFAVVGLLVQQASGRSFVDYVRTQIFEPLGMLRTGALVGPVPSDLAVAYEFKDGRHRSLSPEYLHAAPPGAFYTTGTDMGRFLIAQLRGGTYQGRRILRPETLSLMHAQHFAQTPSTSGWAYGLWEDARDGQRALLHNGGGKGYRALMYLLPQQDAGFFLAYNLADRDESGELQEAFITEFRKRFVPAHRPVDVQLSERVPVERLVGDYLYVRRARSTIEKFISVVNRLHIATDDNGGLVMTGSASGRVSLLPLGPLLFRRSDNHGVVAFEEMDDGRPERLIAVADSGFPSVYERIPLIVTLRVQLAWLCGMALIFLYATAWRPLVAVVHRRTRTKSLGPERSSTWLGGIASALNLVFLVGFPLAFLGRMEGGFPDFVYGVPVVARLLLFIPPVTTVGAVATSIAVVGMWRDAEPPVAVRLGHGVVAIALLSFIVFAWYWNLLAGLRN